MDTNYLLILALLIIAFIGGYWCGVRDKEED